MMAHNYYVWTRAISELTENSFFMWNNFKEIETNSVLVWPTELGARSR